jgi:hypothetical protein
VGRIFLGERSVNMEMVRDGFAWRYVQYDKPGEFTAAEVDAREHRRACGSIRIRCRLGNGGAKAANAEEPVKLRSNDPRQCPQLVEL